MRNDSEQKLKSHYNLNFNEFRKITKNIEIINEVKFSNNYDIFQEK